MGLGAIAVLNSPICPKPSDGRVAHIQAVVCRHYGIPIGEMTSARRSRAVARPRQVAMYLARERTPFSLPHIGRLFGNRDHTTVLHAIRMIELLSKGNKGLARDLSELREALEA
jgi:chromosomal replication initiator protein